MSSWGAKFSGMETRLHEEHLDLLQFSQGFSREISVDHAK